MAHSPAATERAALGYCPVCGTALDAGGPGGRPECPACGYVRYADPKVATGVVAALGLPQSGSTLELNVR